MAVPELNKILLVEDEPDIRTIAEIALKDIGQFNVKLCCSGVEALQYAEQFGPDLILLDMMMPEMDGVETLKALQKKTALEKTPIIFLTAKAQTNEIQYYHELGALDVITKPFDPMTLAEKIRTIWKQHHESGHTS